MGSYLFIWLLKERYFPLSIILSSFYFPVFELMCFLVDEWRMQNSKQTVFKMCEAPEFLTQYCLIRLYKLPGHLQEVYVCRLFSAVLRRTFSHAVVHLLHSFFLKLQPVSSFLECLVTNGTILCKHPLEWHMVTVCVRRDWL